MASKRSYSKHFSTKVTPQTQAIPGRESEMVANNAGGVTFTVSPLVQLDRFLILGSEGGTYYVGEHKLTVENAKNVVNLIKSDGITVVDRVLAISRAGRAHKREPSIFVLALAATLGDETVRSHALSKVRDVCRIPTDLFTFMQFIQDLGGWGRGKRNAIARWYLNGDVDDLAYQVVKYRQRNGWTHRDALRLSHPRVPEKDKARNTLFKWIVKQGELKRGETKDLPTVVKAFEKAQKTEEAKLLVPLITKHKLTWEMLPTEALNDKAVWPALLANMPLQAMVRMLGRMTANGTLTQFGEHTKTVIAKLGDVEQLRKSRLHPMKLLIALKTYQRGAGLKGSLTWKPIPQITEAIEEAFYASFGFIEATNKRFVLGIDISGSMGTQMGDTGITFREGAAVMAMVTARLERDSYMFGFDHTFKPLDITRKDTLDAVLKKLSHWSGGATDCSIPMTHALANKIPVDMFCVYTDNETWAGRIQPSQALKQYRKAMGINAKLVVVGMAANKFTIADPVDAGMMDVVGFDGGTPEIIADFARN